MTTFYVSCYLAIEFQAMRRQYDEEEEEDEEEEMEEEMEEEEEENINGPLKMI